MHYYTVYLPTKGYIKKYMQTLHGSPVVINPKSKFGNVILTNLSSNLHCRLKPVDIDLRLNRFSEKLILKIPMDYWYRLNLKDIGQSMTININRYLEDDFEESLYEIVQRSVMFIGMERQQAIEYFAQNHGIELDADVTFEALKKMEYRRRKEEQKNFKNILADLSPAPLLFQNI